MVRNLVFTSAKTKFIERSFRVCRLAGYNCDSNSPCTAENIAAGDLYWPAEEAASFVQCDAHGGCWVRPCASGSRWNQLLLTCEHATSECCRLGDCWQMSLADVKLSGLNTYGCA